MILTVKPAFFLKGKVQLPASKSYSIRAFMIAACGGRSTVMNPSNCDDAKVAIRVIRFLGAQVKEVKRGPMAHWEITANRQRSQLSKISVKESGTVLRFLLPLLALRGKNVVVVGEGTLRGRPNLFLTKTLRAMGVNIKGQGKDESIPIEFKGGTLRGGNVTIDGSLSSQFVSALLIASPQLAQDTRLTLQGRRLVSTDYITMTCQVLEQSGIKIGKKGVRNYQIKGKQEFKGLKNFTVPSDYGLAAFLLAAAALNNSEITLNGNLRDELVQADGHILSFLDRMGVNLYKTPRSIQTKGPFELVGGNFSLRNCPDLVPIMTILALFARGRTRLYNIGHARVKESDRITDLRTELLKVGAKITEKRDELVIDPQDKYKNDRLLDPHKDHRLAMAFCVLGLKLGVRVNDIECTHKSYPDFVRHFKAIGAVVHKK
ncbi:MAG: 3-phosphoshikimate 1-carboxyvinyltransferase [Candidatus Omnitrophica bacterium]|nr:3-phosphoshikimate 1-carboxyvinyltransferase [Candidatus Omnitrophota bacterium]